MHACMLKTWDAFCFLWARRGAHTAIIECQHRLWGQNSQLGWRGDNQDRGSPQGLGGVIAQQLYVGAAHYKTLLGTGNLPACMHNLSTLFCRGGF